MSTSKDFGDYLIATYENEDDYYGLSQVINPKIYGNYNQIEEYVCNPNYILNC